MLDEETWSSGCWRFQKQISSIGAYLTDHRRILSIDDMELMLIDPGPMIWKGLAHRACRSFGEAGKFSNERGNI